jgi:hypothetical protein
MGGRKNSQGSNAGRDRKGVVVRETAIINRIGQEINVSQVLIAHKDTGGQLLYFRPSCAI